ncbi:uncharacterized protein LOC126055456 isoform X1 [Helicoverpa armigera]|uniref:uncharacterized protein LOC126055456 isoform X1 n=1 Tax=Helicoverpa armigera TaxID=29058 RepID=UPI000B399812|nr:uncharacterized protein LOC110372179 isoform X1 [Helicoverpa armigera]XP_049700659.1 uncharacterized protein LOC126055456 isoform X1 [Helicoverpa armigera]
MARMELPVLDKFCFIFDLRTGCIVMGIINSILTFILAVLLITFAVDIRDASEMKRDDIDSGMSSVVYTIVVLLVVLLFVKFLLDLVFAYAVYKEKCGIMKKYCIFWIIFLVLFIIGFLKTLFHMDAGYVIAQILFLAENFYYIVVIRSYLISINEDGVL